MNPSPQQGPTVAQKARAAQAARIALVSRSKHVVGSAPRVATSRGTPTAPAPEPSASERPRLVTPTRVFFLIAALLIYLGWRLPTERYLSPESGLGYVLGIAGGSAILILLLYPARKRFRWLGFIGSTQGWFQTHMMLGIIGPLLVLFHANFSLGATNSNAALISMLIVSGSGIVGRYFYTRIHLGLYGRRASRADLQAAAADLKANVVGSQFMPELLARLDAADERLLVRRPGALRTLVRPVFVTARMYLERWRLRRYASRQLKRAAAQSPIIAEQRKQLRKTLRRYIGRRLQASRRVAEFESYERLFSLWHVLHLPLFFILLIAGIVHVISVHVY